MLEALGWNLGQDLDAEFAEHVPIRQLNHCFLETGVFDFDTATSLVSELAKPWALKDPRFAMTLPQWYPVFGPHEPVLVWITKDRALVRQSYVRRREKTSDIGRNLALCQRWFDEWPWGKVTVDAAQIADAVSLFDLSRMQGSSHATPAPRRPVHRMNKEFESDDY
jgi:hypothetical protein